MSESCPTWTCNLLTSLFPSSLTPSHPTIPHLSSKVLGLHHHLFLHGKKKQQDLKPFTEEGILFSMCFVAIAMFLTAVFHVFQPPSANTRWWHTLFISPLDQGWPVGSELSQKGEK